MTAELRAEVLHLEDDLRARVTSQPEVEAAWRDEYEASRASERTSATWEAWVDERVTLAAVAWALTTVFVRFCEDNDLVKPVWITHSGARHAEALDAQQHFLREAARTNPDITDREWLLEAVGYLRQLQATAGLVDGNSPMWLVQPSGDAATRLLNFWRERDDDGVLLRDMTDADLDTRFLGDLYQEISEDAQKRFALLQTPVFVEEFILDRALEPALNERPLEGFRAIDPTCGSGHFLLGIFHRLLDRWHRKAPNMDERERVQTALDAVHGVDINPFAVSIARFRLTVAALQACGMMSLEEAPAFKYHLAAGDSLLHGLAQEELDFGAEMASDRVAANFAYATENLTELKRILRNGQYDCVVGNPPYIAVKDASLNALYRRRYPVACKGQYHLSSPFTVRFFELGHPSGRTGLISDDAFMKREFGVPLIEKFLASKDLELVANTSGAYLPGHGTPTVILVGRNRAPRAGSVRAVLGVRGEPGVPDDPSRGLVWTEMLQNVDDPTWEGEFVAVRDVARSTLAVHPWQLKGGSAAEAKMALEASSQPLSSLLVFPPGLAIRAGSDDAYTDPGPLVRREVGSYLRPFVVGAGVRDWGVFVGQRVLYPYASEGPADAKLEGALWPLRTTLAARKTFQGSMADSALHWTEYQQHTKSAYDTPESLVIANISTHLECAFHEQPGVFKETVIVLKLREGSPDAGVQAVLNSAAANFWLKQVCYPKGGDKKGGKGARVTGEAWEERYSFNGTNIAEIPMPVYLPSVSGERLRSLASEAAATTPQSIVEGETAPTADELSDASVKYAGLRAEMISRQEELDWEVYRLYGIVDEDLTYSGDDLPGLGKGQRAFEMVLARRMRDGAETSWFSRHGSTPITEIPEHWPKAYRELVQKRISLIESSKFINLLERPEYKRRWVTDPWEQKERSLRDWLLDRLEHRAFWFDSHGRPAPQSVATLADEVSRDADMVAVLALWEGRPDVPVVKSLESLLANEAVPYLAAYRYKEPGLRKHADWESTWELQRREDAGTYKPARKELGGDGPIPVPPKYKSSDFRKPEYWAHRGKLDVPKERFILYPDAGRETDPTPMLGWAGWDHAERALAIAMLIQQRESDGWEDERLVPLVAGLAEVLPWVQQWHDEPDDRFGGANLAEFMAEQLEERMTQVEATADQLKAWRPAPAKKGRKAKA
nr:BREX-2 system adenine-specific DNA-methyltransferase PglX [Garicola koreensis]